MNKANAAVGYAKVRSTRTRLYAQLVAKSLLAQECAEKISQNRKLNSLVGFCRRVKFGKTCGVFWHWLWARS